MSKSKESGRSFSTLNLILVIQLVVMLGLSIFITLTVSSKTRENAINHMNGITDERANIIKSYVENSEKTLSYFSKSQQIIDMFMNPDDGTFKSAAQEYTTQFAKDIEHNEGLWSGTLQTEVLTHSSYDPENPDTAGIIGMVTRKDEDKRKQLIDALEAAGPDGVYNTGIIISPASGKQCLSMYKGVFQNDKMIGFVGLGIYTEGLIDTLDKVPVPGIKNSFYTMVNVNTNKYIFNKDDKMVDKEIENSDLLDLCKKYKGQKDSVTDEYEYEADGKSYVSIYTYIPEYGWILTIDDTPGEVFELQRTMIIYLGIFGIVVIGLIVVFNIISKKQERINQKLVSTITKANLTKKSLNTAMFKDVLTDVNNRVSLTVDLQKAAEQKKTDPYYFVMFNICNFSGINSEFGTIAGDNLLARIGQVLKEHYEPENIYRTGSDEFVVKIPTAGGSPAKDEIMDRVNMAFRELQATIRIDQDTAIYPTFKVAVVKTKNNVDASVVSSMKDMTNKTGEATYGLIDFRDMT